MMVRKKTLPTLVAVVQMCSRDNKELNLRTITKNVHRAAMRGAALICLPEACLYLGTESIENAEIIPPLSSSSSSSLSSSSSSSSANRLQELAISAGAWLSVGGVHVLAPDTEEPAKGRVFNRHLLISPVGRIAAQYDKVHLFDNNLTGLNESDTTIAGDKPGPIVDTGFARIGLTTCYDLR